MMLTNTGVAIIASKKDKQSYLDWVVLKAYLALNLPPATFVDTDSGYEENPNYKLILDSLTNVLLALLSLRRWGEAASLSMEISKAFPCAVRHLQLAVLALTTAGNYKLALIFSLKLIEEIFAEAPISSYPEIARLTTGFQVQ